MLFKCEEFDYRVVIMLKLDVGFKVIVKKLLVDNDMFYVSFWFCLYVEEGFLLLWSVIKVKFYFCFLVGSLFYDVIVFNGLKIVLCLGFKFDDGEWYNVNVSVRGREVCF